MSLELRSIYPAAHDETELNITISSVVPVRNASYDNISEMSQREIWAVCRAGSVGVGGVYALGIFDFDYMRGVYWL